MGGGMEQGTGDGMDASEFQGPTSGYDDPFWKGCCCLFLLFVLVVFVGRWLLLDNCLVLFFFSPLSPSRVSRYRI